MFNLAAVKVPLSAEEQREDATENMKKHIYNYTKKSIALERRLRNLDFTTRKAPFRQYLILCSISYRIVMTQTFNNIIFMCILLAGLLVGLQTYPGMSGDPVVKVLDTFVLAVFTLEVVLKIMSEGMEPKKYFVGSEWHWNNFDFCIVFFSMPFLPFGNGQVAFLRLIRLMRLAKVFRKVPQLRMIMTGLIGGLKSIVYIVILLFLVFYLYAVAGIYFFRDNDPWHFRSVEISMMSLFRLATLSNWADMFYINYYGCDVYSGGLYVTDKEDLASTKLGDLMYCGHPNAQAELSIFYFVTFIFICSFSMLSLFVGAITVSMSESMEMMKIEKEKLRKAKRLEQAHKQLDQLEFKKKIGKRVKQSLDLLKLAFNGDKVEVLFHIDPNEPYIIQCYQRLAHQCEVIVEASWFQNFVTFVIVLAGVLVGMKTDPSIAMAYREILSALDMFIQVIFTLEVGLKIIAEELSPWVYFENRWNVFDFFVVIGSYINGGGSLIIMLRLLRLLRVLKLMRALPQLQVIVSALMTGLSSIAFIAIILFLFFYFFGIIAMILFGVNDPWHFGTLHMTIITLFQCSTLDNWTDIMYINMYGCDLFGYDDFPELCTTPQPQFLWTALYFMVFILLGALVLLTLFIGVVATSMEEATHEQEEAKIVEDKVAIIARDNDLSPSTIEHYKEVFEYIDLNDGNFLEIDELRLGLKTAGRSDISDTQFQKLWAMVDADGSGGIDFSEFLTFMLNLRAIGKRSKSVANLLALVNEEPDPTPIGVEHSKSVIGMTDPGDVSSRDMLSRIDTRPTTAPAVVRSHSAVISVPVTPKPAACAEEPDEEGEYEMLEVSRPNSAVKTQHRSWDRISSSSGDDEDLRYGKDKVQSNQDSTPPPMIRSTSLKGALEETETDKTPPRKHITPIVKSHSSLSRTPSKIDPIAFDSIPEAANEMMSPADTGYNVLPFSDYVIQEEEEEFKNAVEEINHSYSSYAETPTKRSATERKAKYLEAKQHSDIPLSILRQVSNNTNSSSEDPRARTSAARLPTRKVVSKACFI